MTHHHKLQILLINKKFIHGAEIVVVVVVAAVEVMEGSVGKNGKVGNVGVDGVGNTVDRKVISTNGYLIKFYLLFVTLYLKISAMN